MSKKVVKNLLEDLADIPKDDNISVQIKETKDEIKSLPKIDDDKELNKIKKKVRRKIKILEKQAGKKESNAKKITNKLSKAKGTGGGNDNGARCYIRYNNRGNPYRICDDGTNPSNQKKPPSVITPAIDPEDFANKFGGYANLSKEQQRTYHRLYMRRVRKQEQEDNQAGEDVANVIRAKRRVAKEQARVKKLEEKQKKLEMNDKIFKYRQDLKNNFTTKTRIGARKKLLKKYGLTAEDVSKKNVRQSKSEKNQSNIEQAKSNIETEQEFIDKSIKSLDDGGIELQGKGKAVTLTF